MEAGIRGFAMREPTSPTAEKMGAITTLEVVVGQQIKQRGVRGRRIGMQRCSSDILRLGFIGPMFAGAAYMSGAWADIESVLLWAAGDTRRTALQRQGLQVSETFMHFGIYRGCLHISGPASSDEPPRACTEFGV